MLLTFFFDDKINLFKSNIHGPTRRNTTLLCMPFFELFVRDLHSLVLGSQKCLLD